MSECPETFVPLQRGCCGSPASAGMAPTSIQTRETKHRFPRIRGDGPFCAELSSEPPSVPPHPRGWPRGREYGFCGQSGSPASAGMAPSPSSGYTRPYRFPRIRGDGPSLEMLRSMDMLVPPHPRGWPPAGRGSFLLPPGSPASAGMVRIGADRSRRPGRFPRIRGDGPYGDCYATKPNGVPPHPRGWSQSELFRAAFGAGSPASAGMVPRRWRTQCPSIWFPRIRGDGPFSCPSAP